MGIGHVAVGFAAKRVVPAAPLALLLVTGIFLDVLWGGAILLGLEHAHIDTTLPVAMPIVLTDIPWTHSLPMALLWSGLFAAVVAVVTRRALLSVVCAIGVFSHYALDVVAHTPDMPVGLHGPVIGLGLWRWPFITVAVESAMVIGGIWLYLSATREAGARGRTTTLIIGAVIVAIGAAAYLGPKPPSITPMAAMNIVILGICLGIGSWLERLRKPA